LGPITGFALWNEPWEGGSVDYWGADCLRFRELYTAMSKGIIAARQQAGVNVLLCGCDSTSNTMDKLFFRRHGHISALAGRGDHPLPGHGRPVAV
jgi:hypothetical protein